MERYGIQRTCFQVCLKDIELHRISDSVVSPDSGDNGIEDLDLRNSFSVKIDWAEGYKPFDSVELNVYRSADSGDNKLSKWSNPKWHENLLYILQYPGLLGRKHCVFRIELKTQWMCGLLTTSSHFGVASIDLMTLTNSASFGCVLELPVLVREQYRSKSRDTDNGKNNNHNNNNLERYVLRVFTQMNQQFQKSHAGFGRMSIPLVPAKDVQMVALRSFWLHSQTECLLRFYLRLKNRDIVVENLLMPAELRQISRRHNRESCFEQNMNLSNINSAFHPSNHFILMVRPKEESLLRYELENASEQDLQKSGWVILVRNLDAAISYSTVLNFLTVREQQGWGFRSINDNDNNNLSPMNPMNSSGSGSTFTAVSRELIWRKMGSAPAFNSNLPEHFIGSIDEISWSGFGEIVASPNEETVEKTQQLQTETQLWLWKKACEWADLSTNKPTPIYEATQLSQSEAERDHPLETWEVLLQDIQLWNRFYQNLDYTAKIERVLNGAFKME